MTAYGHTDVPDTPVSPASKKSSGFAAMDRQKQREIASSGGKKAHEKGTAHEFDTNEA